MSRSYHEGELEIAQNSTHPAHILPPDLPPGATVLDIGCGAGQTLIAAYPGRRTVGLDLDIEALQLGQSWTSDVQFICSSAERLPFADQTFDAVIARVSLAYTDLSRSLSEARRVLKETGLLWMVLHPPSIPLKTARQGGGKAWVFFLYISLNSLLFHLSGRMVPFLGRYESFQTVGGITRALERNRFTDITISQGRHFVVAARSR